MTQSSNIGILINQCVVCEGKFTSADKPLKLLPCLHSMCLDCLYGQTAVLVTKNKLQQSTAKKDTTVKEDSPDSETSPTEEKKCDDEETKQTDNGEKDGESVKSPNKNNDEVSESENKVDATEVSDKSGVTDSQQDVDNTSEVVDGSDKVKDDDPETKVTEDKEMEAWEMKPKPTKECPLCKDTVFQSPMSLMDNMFATLDQQDQESQSDNSTHVCTACEEGEEANSYCVQCEEWLCDSCVDAHKRVRITKDHTISPKDQVSSTTSKSAWEQQMMCKQHRQEQLKFFCEKCETMTCRDCQLMDHKEHKYQFMDQAAEQYKARLKGSLALMGEKRSKLSSSRSEIEKKLSNCKEQKDTVKADVLRQADILVNKMRTAVSGVLSNLASFTDAATKRLNKEIEDVSDLIGKFDHCIQFMEEILDNGTSMSLLYSKVNVEAKCRKVYHTQVDPQSLKGNLVIQYKHDVNWLLSNLSKIGSIFINGVRYPPEKPSNTQNARHPPSTSPSTYQPDSRSGLTATSPHLQHLANQNVPGQRGDDWSKFIHTVSKSGPGQGPQGPPNMNVVQMQGSANSLPPQLTLPSRRSSATTMSHPSMPGSNFSNHFPPAQHMGQQQPRQMFTPMRLHHRPASSNSSNQNDSKAWLTGNMGNNTTRSPPQYRMGGEASGSNVNHSRSSHGTPDPARPASAGMYDNRPDSGGGGTAPIDIKRERHDRSPDCVITASSLRSERQSMLFQTSPVTSRISETALEMQKSLDEVLRAVPMDPSENLEQINGSKSVSEVMAPRKVASPLSNLHTNALPVPTPEKKSPTDEELRENWQGGNSMPGFSNPSNVEADPNDDYCACCHNGGDVLCCDNCPRVFHLKCHIPEIPSVPSGSFVCTICEGDLPVEPEEFNANGKRKSPLTEHDIKVCRRMLLDLFCHPSSIPFHEPVNQEQVPNYYKIITQPRDFTQIKGRLEGRNVAWYSSIKAFLYDVRQVFINCGIYNKEHSEVGKAGRIVRSCFEKLVQRLMMQYFDFVKENPTPCFSALQGDPEFDSLMESNGGAEGLKRSGGETENSSDLKRMKMGTDIIAPSFDAL